MPNRNLNADELTKANLFLKEIRDRLKALASDDRELLFAYRRKLAKELSYDERGKPSQRKAVKLPKWAMQDRKCAHCGEEMPLKYSELDRRSAADGYTVENTDLIHAKCHHDRQAANGYT